MTCTRTVLADVCRGIAEEWHYGFAGLIVEEGASAWQLRYAFYGEGEASSVHVLVSAPLTEKVFPSVVEWIHAEDWHEREAEDMFGVRFEGNPHLGDFILHDDVWQEGVEPMRHGFDAQAAMRDRRPNSTGGPGASCRNRARSLCPLGLSFPGITEICAFFAGNRGRRRHPLIDPPLLQVARRREARRGQDGRGRPLVGERFAATTAFAHGLAFCQGVESVCSVQVPPRARALRVFLAELERLRQHAGAIQEICESTALAVATSQAGLLEEDLLRLSGELTGHRYLFGLLAPGGLLCDLPTNACRGALERAQHILTRLDELERRLRISSSFLDRIEEVGAITAQTARSYSLVGPVARASGLVRDLRRTLPYSGYEVLGFDVPSEREGDGYARLRVLFAESRQSVRIMEQVVSALMREGEVYRAVQYRSGAALGSVEAPRGATYHWLRLNEGGRIARYRIITPSFTNWHSFHLAAEKFAFQDFPSFSRLSICPWRRTTGDSESRAEVMSQWVLKGLRTGIRSRPIRAPQSAPPASRPAAPRRGLRRRRFGPRRTMPHRSACSDAGDHLGGQPPLCSLLPLRPWHRASAGREPTYEWAGAAAQSTNELGRPFRRSIHILVVDAGDCGACLNEVKQLNNPYYNMHRLGFSSRRRRAMRTCCWSSVR